MRRSRAPLSCKSSNASATVKVLGPRTPHPRPCPCRHASKALVGTVALAVLVGTVLILVLAPARPAAAGPFDAHGEDWEGMSQLVRMAQAQLGPQRVVVTSRLSLGDLGARGRLCCSSIPSGTLDVGRARRIHARRRAAGAPRRLRDRR